MTPQDVIDQVRNLIQDTEAAYQRYDDDFLLGILNQVLKRMVSYRPDLFITNGTIATTASTVAQTLPTGAVRLMEIYQVTDGDAITEVNRETLDQMYPGWRSEAASTPVNWMRHPRNPDRYFLYPRPSASITLEAEYVASPDDLALGDTIELPESYFSALVDGVVWLAEAVDTESIGNGRAKYFQDMFFDSLGVDLAVRKMVDDEDGQVHPQPAKKGQQQNG